MVDGPVLGKDGSICDRHRLEQNAVWHGFGFEIMGLHKDSRENGHSLSKSCNGAVLGLYEL